MKKYNLVQKKCKANSRVYRDVLIYKDGYQLTNLDKMFIQEIFSAKNKYLID